jgi:hypothetical protein
VSQPGNTGRPRGARTRRGETLPVRPLGDWNRRARSALARALRVALVDANVSTATLARSIGASPRAVERWLDGSRACSLARLHQMAAALGLPADHLI